MTADTFPIEFPFIAIQMAIGFSTTVEYCGKIYSFKKIAPGRFEPIL